MKSLTFFISTVPINSPFLNCWLGRLAQSLMVLTSLHWETWCDHSVPEFYNLKEDGS
jgi:hypothetical protein